MGEFEAKPTKILPGSVGSVGQERMRARQGEAPS